MTYLTTVCPACGSATLESVTAGDGGATTIDGQPVKRGDRVHQCTGGCGAIVKARRPSKSPAKGATSRKSAPKRTASRKTPAKRPASRKSRKSPAKRTPAPRPAAARERGPGGRFVSTKTTGGDAGNAPATTTTTTTTTGKEGGNA